MSPPRRHSITLGISLYLALLLASAVAAAPENDKAKADPPAPPKAHVVYKPPLRGAPSTRVGGGTRGDEAGSALLSVLAPDHTGWTAKNQPTLYWYISKSVNAPVELTVIDQVSVTALLEITVSRSAQAGIQALSLADHGIRIKPGVEYRWSVALVVDAEQRSSDVVSSATISYVEPVEEVKRRLGQAIPETLALIYSETGYWYDAIEAVSKLIEEQPDNRRMKAQRAALTEQVGLPEVAGYDRR